MLARLIVPGSLVRIKRISFLNGDLLPWIRSVTPLLMGNLVCLCPSLSELQRVLGSLRPDKRKPQVPPRLGSVRLAGLRSFSFFRFAACEENGGRGFAHLTQPMECPGYAGANVGHRPRERTVQNPWHHAREGPARSLDKSDSRFTRRPNFDGTVQQVHRCHNISPVSRGTATFGW
jgi:hypothetical protein